MHQEFRAITTRFARSFVRVGSLELYARRWRRTGDPLALRQLEELFWYVRDKEGYGTGRPPLAEAGLELIVAARRRLISMALHWKRVGYVQSNFNSDNCLVGGSTLDYGPFGFMERYDPKWAMWVGSGEHFSFGNQVEAARRNWEEVAARFSLYRGREGFALGALSKPSSEPPLGNDLVAGGAAGITAKTETNAVVGFAGKLLDERLVRPGPGQRSVLKLPVLSEGRLEHVGGEEALLDPVRLPASAGEK